VNRNACLLLLALCCSGCAPAPAPGSSATAHTHNHAAHEDEHEHKEAHTEGEHKHEEGEVELSDEQIRRSGILSQTVQQRTLRPTLQLPATIVGDPDRSAKVSARVEGIIEQLPLRVGDRVREGQLVAVLTSPEVARLQAEYRKQQVEIEVSSGNLRRRVSLAKLGDTVRRPYEEAVREVAQARNGVQAARAGFRLAEQKLDRLEDLLKDGIASQQQVDEARAGWREQKARLAQAELELTVANTHLGRERRLAGTGLLADNEAYQAEADLRRAQAAAEASLQALRSVGAEPGNGDGRVELFSPLSGWIVERPKNRGEQVQAGAELLSVLDTGTVWCWVNLPETLVGSVPLGAVAQVLIGSRQYAGKITYITPQTDPDTKKTLARVELHNPDGTLRPNMFAQVLLPQGKERKSLAVPRQAVVQMENRDVVYVQEDPHHFHRHPIKVGQQAGNWVEVLEGIEAADKVVVEGAAIVQSEDQKATMGEAGHSH
jgi:membrane fusion protein, heavy metal efflux system